MSCVKHMDFPKHHPFPVLSGLHWSIKALPEKKKHPGEGTFHVVETNVAAFPALQVKAVIKLLWGPAMRFFGINVAHTGEVENIPNQKGQTKTINPKVWLLSWLEILWDPNSSHSGSSQTPSFPSSVSPPYGPVHIALQLPGELQVYGKCQGCQTIPTVRMYIAHWGIFFAKKTFQITIQTWQKKTQKLSAKIHCQYQHFSLCSFFLPAPHHTSCPWNQNESIAAHGASVVG